MFGLYYRIWVDCIKALRMHPINQKDWHTKSMLAMSIAMTFNFAIISIVVQKYLFGYYFYEINLSFLPEYLSNVIDFLVLIVLPCVGLNYLLIFWKQRYVKLLKKYPFYKGNLFLTYFMISMLLPIILLFIGIIFFR